ALLAAAPALRRALPPAAAWALLAAALFVTADAKEARAEDPQLLGRGNGQRGLLAAAYLAAHAAPGEPLMAYHDVAYYAGRPFYPVLALGARRAYDVGRIEALLAGTPL